MKHDTTAQGQPTYIFADAVPVIDSMTGEQYWVAPGLENLDTGLWMLITVPIARRWSNGQRDPANWTSDRLHEVLLKDARVWNNGRQGPWIYHPRKVASPEMEPQPPADPAEVRAAILAGPDTQGKAWLLQHPAGPTPENCVAVFRQVEREPGQEG